MCVFPGIANANMLSALICLHQLCGFFFSKFVILFLGSAKNKITWFKKKKHYFSHTVCCCFSQLIPLPLKPTFLKYPLCSDWSTGPVSCDWSTAV